jgi:uncharacterized protein YutE (UPF0331/DUF86 family)
VAELLLNKLLSCRERVERIRNSLPAEPSSVLSDERLEAFLAFQIFLLIQDLSDLANHLVAAKGLGVPGSQREAFMALARAGIITTEAALEMAAAAALRNRIAHTYGDVDPVRLVREAPQGLAAITRFLDQMTEPVASLGVHAEKQ